MLAVVLKVLRQRKPQEPRPLVTLEFTVITAGNALHERKARRQVVAFVAEDCRRLHGHGAIDALRPRIVDKRRIPGTNEPSEAEVIIRVLCGGLRPAMFPRRPTTPFGNLRIQRGNDLRTVLDGLIGTGNDVLLLRGVVNAHELSGIADVVMRIDLAVDHMTHHIEIVLGAVHGRQQERDDRLGLLSVAVDSSVALLKGNQRPRNVKVNEPMSKIVQVYAL